jgi:hypothetical protein
VKDDAAPSPKSVSYVVGKPKLVFAAAVDVAFVPPLATATGLVSEKVFPERVSPVPAANTLNAAKKVRAVVPTTGLSVVRIQPTLPLEDPSPVVKITDPVTKASVVRVSAEPEPLNT